MLKTQHRVNYLKKGISSEVIDRLEEQRNAQQSSKYLQFKNRIRRYDPNDTNIAKLFLMIREQKIGNPKLDKINEIEELLAQVENINDIDLNDGGNTPLHVAVSKKHQNIVGLLLNDHDIDPNIKNNQGDTPLHIAASENNKELVSLLLDKEARSDIKNNEGKAPYELTKNPEIINIFQQKGFQSSDYDDLADQAYLDGELIKIVRSSIPEERKLNDIGDFLQKGANINFRDANCESNTPLHAAVRKQELEVVKLLVQKGAMQIKNSKGKMPLDIAISLNHKDIIQELSGAPFLKRENTGENKPEVSSPKKPKLSSTKVQGSKGTKLLHGEIKLEDSQVNEYSARGSKDALHGNVYQLKLLMLFLKRGLDKGYSFLLATEMTAAEKFDDLVFQYEEDKVDGIGKEKVWRFLQAKHKQDESKKITLSGLLTKEDGEFSLQKYFISYRKIRQKPEFQGSRLKDFIICTNIDLYDDLESSFSPVTYEDDILNMQPNDKNKSHRFLKLKIDEFGTLPHESKDLVSILKEASDLNRLAKMLAEHVFSSKSEGKGINLRNDLFKQYHVALARGVIDVTAKKFHASFIDNDKLSGEVEKFRKALLKESNLQEQEFKNRMRICTLKISDTFGKVLKIEGDPQITQKDSSNPVQELAKRIVDMIHQEKEGVVTIERRMNIIKDNLDKLAGHVFIKDTEKDLIKFRQGFLNGGTLPGNLDDFRKKLNTELLSKKIEFSQLGQYQLKISNFYTCTEEDYEDKSYLKQTTQTLPNDEVKDEEISEFSGKLVFAVNQPNEVELGKMLEVEISEEFKKKFDYTGELGKYAYDGFQREILNWMKEKKGSFLSIVEVSEFFNEFVREVSTLGAIKEGVKRIEEKLVKSNIMLSEIHSHVVAKQNNERTQKSILFNVCNPSQVFTGRKTELEKLRESIQGSQGVATVISQLVSISGLGGVGKTELVRKHIKEHSEDYDNNIIWVNAETYETMVQSFLKLASELLDIPTKDRGIESIVRDIYAFFAKRKSLFVFDNAEKYRSEDQDAGISQFLPSNFLSPYGNKPSVLITSRNKKWGDIKPLILGAFTEPESIDFIRKALGIKDESQENEIKNLAETLQHFPLALQQAVAYIKERDIALKNVDSKFEIGDYLKRYKEETEKLLDFKFPEDSNDSYTKTTFTTWRITIDKIQDNLEYGRQAKEILDIIAYIAPDNIPAEMFLGLERNREELGDAIQLLKKYSVIDSGEEQSSINIHRLVQQVTRMELEKQSKDKVVKKTFELLKESFPCDSDKLEDYAKRRRLLPHLKAFSSHIDDWLKENPPEKQIIEKDYLVNLLIWAGNEYRNLGDLHKQKECLERALPIFQKYLGDNPLGLAITLLNLGIACGDLGFYQEQKDYIEKAVSIFQQHPDNPLGLARALTNLGIAYGDLDDRQGEKTYLEKAEFILGEHPGGNTLELAKALVSLGDAYGASGDCQKKKKCLEDAVPIFREHHGDNPLELARVLVSLGNAYGALGDRQKKKKCLEEAEFILGEPSKDNPLKVAVILVSLGVGYGALNENEKRKKHLEDAVSIFRQHPYNALELAIALVNLGIAYGASGYHQKKKKCLEEAVSIFRQLPDKPLELAGALVSVKQTKSVKPGRNSQFKF